MAERTHSSRWTVEFACSLDHVLARMSGSAEALRDGRVFVDGKRVFDPLLPLEPGLRRPNNPGTCTCYRPMKT